MRLVIQTKDVFGHWQDTMYYSTTEQARAAWPYWRKDTKREMRCIRRMEEVVDLFATQSTEQPKDSGDA